jgi:hypothetical protein
VGADETEWDQRDAELAEYEREHGIKQERGHRNMVEESLSAEEPLVELRERFRKMKRFVNELVAEHNKLQDRVAELERLTLLHSPQ